MNLKIWSQIPILTKNTHKKSTNKPFKCLTTDLVSKHPSLLKAGKFYTFVWYCIYTECNISLTTGHRAILHISIAQVQPRLQ